jgi:acyl carrier protein
VKISGLTARARQRRLHQLISEVWEEVLGVRDIGLDDDFLALGGNSLHAVRIIARVEESLDIHLSVRAVLDARTVRLMAEQVRLASHPPA